VFNLLPIPPLDGSKLLFALLPDKIYFALMRYERYGVVVLALLLMSGVLNGVLGATQQLLLRFSYEIMLIILF
jgi:Zn-dependent protease